mmetsp:Transcript_304/g.355  ORF Transcript_304/g.355 Transcript_304/m.355 type:complete len:1049 (+) Transcript_304:119-3265(+)
MGACHSDNSPEEEEERNIQRKGLGTNTASRQISHNPKSTPTSDEVQEKVRKKEKCDAKVAIAESGNVDGNPALSNISNEDISSNFCSQASAAGKNEEDPSSVPKENQNINWGESICTLLHQDPPVVAVSFEDTMDKALEFICRWVGLGANEISVLQLKAQHTLISLQNKKLDSKCSRDAGKAIGGEEEGYKDSLSAAKLSDSKCTPFSTKDELSSPGLPSTFPQTLENKENLNIRIDAKFVEEKLAYLRRQVANLGRPQKSLDHSITEFNSELLALVNRLSSTFLPSLESASSNQNTRNGLLGEVRTLEKSFAQSLEIAFVFKGRVAEFVQHSGMKDNCDSKFMEARVFTASYKVDQAIVVLKREIAITAMLKERVKILTENDCGRNFFPKRTPINSPEARTLMNIARECERKAENESQRKRKRKAPPPSFPPPRSRSSTSSSQPLREGARPRSRGASLIEENLNPKIGEEVLQQKYNNKIFLFALRLGLKQMRLAKESKIASSRETRSVSNSSEKLPVKSIHQRRRSYSYSVTDGQVNAGFKYNGEEEEEVPFKIRTQSLDEGSPQLLPLHRFSSSAQTNPIPKASPLPPLPVSKQARYLRAASTPTDPMHKAPPLRPLPVSRQSRYLRAVPHRPRKYEHTRKLFTQRQREMKKIIQGEGSKLNYAARQKMELGNPSKLYRAEALFSEMKAFEHEDKAEFFSQGGMKFGVKSFESPAFPGYIPEGQLSQFTFSTLAPSAFVEIRKTVGIKESDFADALENGDLEPFSTNSKSGASFYFSPQLPLIIKIVGSEEYRFLANSIREYHDHVLHNPSTLLARVVAMHLLQLHAKTFHIIVMEAVWSQPDSSPLCQQAPPPQFMHLIYDLKGSTQGRSASAKDIALPPTPSQTATILKDNDLRLSKRIFEIGYSLRNRYLSQLKKDVRFLVRMGVLDYSMLVGVHIPRLSGTTKILSGSVDDDNDGFVSVERNQKSEENMGEQDGWKGPIWSKDKQEVYHIGIIDYLVPYGLRKRGEYFLKSKVQGFGDTISVLPPKEYGERFLEFISKVLC